MGDEMELTDIVYHSYTDLLFYFVSFELILSSMQFAINNKKGIK